MQQKLLYVHDTPPSFYSILTMQQVAVTFGDPYSNQGWGSGGVVGSVMGLGGSGSDLASSYGGRGKSSGSTGVKPAVTTSGGVFNPNNGLIICSTGDFVCGVVPSIGSVAPKATASDTAPAKAGAGHLSYSGDGSIPKAIAFIMARVNNKEEATSAAEPKAAAKPKPKSASQPKSSKPKSPPPSAEEEAAAAE